jgi:hypothetical protein
MVGGDGFFAKLGLMLSHCLKVNPPNSISSGIGRRAFNPGGSHEEVDSVPMCAGNFYRRSL